MMRLTVKTTRTKTVMAKYFRFLVREKKKAEATTLTYGVIMSSTMPNPKTWSGVHAPRVRD